MAYSDSCCTERPQQLSGLGFAFPWGTVIGAAVDAGTSIFGGKYPKPLPPPIDASWQEVQAAMAQSPDLARRIISTMQAQGHTRIYLGREPTASDWSNPKTAAQLALWFANGTGDDLSKGEDEIRQLVLQALAALQPVEIGDVYHPPGGIVTVAPDGTVTSGGPTFPSTTGTQGIEGTAGGITDFLKDQLAELKDNAAALLQMQAQQAAQAAAGGAYQALPPQYQYSIDQGIGRSVLEKYAVPLAVGAAALLFLRR